MSNLINNDIKLSARLSWRLAMLGIVALTGLLLLGQDVSAQVTNAYDAASDPAYVGDGPGNGLGAAGSPNGGFGFGPWTFTVLNSGGAFINGSGPSGASFDLWNTSANSSTIAVRPFSSALVPGQSFSVQTRLNSLDNSGTTNALLLQDSGGHTLFSYWHTGFEPNGAVNGQYSDAAVNDGAAIGFSYGYQQFQSFTFTLTSPTTYTFTDNSTGHSFSGTIAGTIAQVAFFRGSLGSTGGGQDFQFDELQVVSSAPATFGGLVPASGSYSASTTAPISIQVTDGSIPVNTNSIVFKVDGNTVTPSSVSKSINITTISYAPGSPLSWATLHTAQVVVSDSNGVAYTNTWSFTTGFQSLPSILPGPIVASNQEVGIVIFSTNDAWLGANYSSTSGRTIYARFDANFDNLNGENGGGGGYGGLQFILGGVNGAQHVIAGNSWISTNWSVDPYPVPQTDLMPVTPVVFGQWHTIVERVDLSPSANATVTVWLDPDFTQTEASQPNSPVIVSTVNTFDTVALRTGNGTTSATFSNIIMAATSAGVGFAAPAAPQFLNLVPANLDAAAALATPISAEVDFGTYGIGTNTVLLTLDGNPVTPMFVVTSNSIVVSYQPPVPFAANSSHSVQLSVTDSNSTTYSSSWAFTADPYPKLPITIPGPINVIYADNGAAGITLFTAENEWIGTNYQSSSTKTLYTTFTMAFGDLNGESADDQGGCYGGLQFFEGGPENVGVERLLTGESWLRNTWSIDDKQGGEGGELALSPTNVVVVFEYHTLAIKSVYSANSNATETVWLDPDFTKSESNQPNPPQVVSINNTFDTICIRCGNGSANAQFTNMMFAATSPFAPEAPKLAMTSLAGSVNLSWTGAGTLQSAPTLTGPWTDFWNQTNPQVVATTNLAAFFRLRP